MNNIQKATLKRVIKKDTDFLDVFRSYEDDIKQSFAFTVGYMLDYIQEDVKEYLKDKNNYEGLIYILEEKNISISSVTIDGFIYDLDTIYFEFIAYLDTL